MRKKENKIVKTFMVYPRQWEALRKLSREYHWSISALIGKAIDRFLVDLANSKEGKD